jgi:hypothetical protein
MPKNELPADSAQGVENAVPANETTNGSSANAKARPGVIVQVVGVVSKPISPLNPSTGKHILTVTRMDNGIGVDQTVPLTPKQIEAFQLKGLIRLHSKVVCTIERFTKDNNYLSNGKLVQYTGSGRKLVDMRAMTEFEYSSQFAQMNAKLLEDHQAIAGSLALTLKMPAFASLEEPVV